MPSTAHMNAPRLYLDCDLQADRSVPLSREQANYLLNVLRLGSAGRVRVFNGRDGEWTAALRPDGRRNAALHIQEQTQTQPRPTDLHYLFAPLKRARLDYMVQKAVEMGASLLQPVMTARTAAERVNLERMRANAIEAAEQCGILALPAIGEPQTLTRVLAVWPAQRKLVFCDEAAPIADPVEALRTLEPGPMAVLIGPEGGFTDEERQMLVAQPATLRIALGPRILRADTAGVAALTLVNAVLGDWRAP